MRLLHLHCRKSAQQPQEEAGHIAASAELPIESFVSFRPFEAPAPFSLLDDISAIVIGGSDWSVFEDIPHYSVFQTFLHEARRRRLPLFGICFGAQALAHTFGGNVIRDAERAEYGSIEVRREAVPHPVFSDLPDRFHAQAWHQDRISALPKDAVAIAWSQEDVLQAFSFPDELICGVQFHPERTRELFERLLETRQAPSAEHPIEKIRASLRPTPEAASVLARFFRHALAGTAK